MMCCERRCGGLRPEQIVELVHKELLELELLASDADRKFVARLRDEIAEWAERKAELDTLQRGE